MKLTGTQTLEKIIPKANVEIYIRLYHVMKKIPMDTRGGLSDLIWVDVQGEIRRKLGLLVYEDLIDQRDIDDIWTYITRKIILHKKGIRGMEAIGSLLLKDFGKGNKKQDQNRIVNTLIYLLVYDCKMHSGNAQFRVVADFLGEQNICEGLTYKEVSKRYERLGEEAVLLTLHAYHLFMDAPSFLVSVPFAPDGLPQEYDGFLNRVLYQDL